MLGCPPERDLVLQAACGGADFSEQYGSPLTSGWNDKTCDVQHLYICRQLGERARASGMSMGTACRSGYHIIYAWDQGSVAYMQLKSWETRSRTPNIALSCSAWALDKTCGTQHQHHLLPEHFEGQL